MFITIKSYLLASFIVVLSTAITGSFAQATQSTKGQGFTIEQLDTDHIRVVEVKVENNGDSFIVCGKIKRNSWHGTHRGHVDVAIADNDGALILSGSTDFSPPFGKLRKNLESSFSAQFAHVPPEGSTIRIKYHENTSPHAEQEDCGRNVALKSEE